MDIGGYLSSRKTCVDEALGRYLPRTKNAEIDVLLRAMGRGLLAGGKRLRPILTLAAAEAVGGSIEVVLPAACAIEMIHAYSLIHDDLPEMDDAALRRGMPTVHKDFGQAMAVLAGDALLTEAFHLLCREEGAAAVPAALRVRVIREVAEAAGWQGMVGGQVLDLAFEEKEADLAALESIHKGKTSAMIVVSVRTGAILAGADEESLDALERYARAVGLAFQIMDDLLDVSGTEEETGKDVGKDADLGKATFPALLGVEESRRRTLELRGAAIEALSGFDERAEPLRAIAEFVVNRRS